MDQEAPIQKVTIQIEPQKSFEELKKDSKSFKNTKRIDLTATSNLKNSKSESSFSSPGKEQQIEI